MERENRVRKLVKSRWERWKKVKTKKVEVGNWNNVEGKKWSDLEWENESESRVRKCRGKYSECWERKKSKVEREKRLKSGVNKWRNN